MWRIYLILAVCVHPLNAQYDAYIAYNSGREGGRNRNAVHTTDINNDYNLNEPPHYAANNITHYRGRGGERNRNSVRTTYDNTDYNLNVPLQYRVNFNNTMVYGTQLSAHRKYNTNSRDSFGYTDSLGENIFTSPGKEMLNNTQKNKNRKTENSSTTTSSIRNINYMTTQSPRAWKIPTTNAFNARLFDMMSTKASNENLVYSPISLQTILAFIFTMSEGQLYDELAQLLQMSNDRTVVAKIFENILQKSFRETETTTLLMANKLFYDYRFGPIDHRVHNFAKQSFDSEIEQVNFFETKKVANIINSWVSNKTRNLIKDIVSPGSISGDTSALLLNSIYFKSEWQTKFATDDTEKQDFFLTKHKKILVDMMYNEDVFRYGDFSEELEASVVELPYKGSNISMFLILPQDLEGLQSLERKLRNYDLQSLSRKLKREMVTLKLPKFKVGFETNMIKALQEMGLTALFNNAGSIVLFKNQQKPVKIDQFKHKSFIDVNEAGTEAAAATIAKYVPLSVPTDMKYFVADHPFVFVIRDANSTFFMGHVVKF